MHSKPFSQACENNKVPILEVLRRAFRDCKEVLEIGSGTGQHAVYFAGALSHLNWQTSDCAENLAGIHLWLADAQLQNTRAPVELNVTQPHWPNNYDAVFSANTAHIMSWEVARRMIRKVGETLPQNGVFALYGPFNYQRAFTSESNRLFDEWLKSIDPARGIRDFEVVEKTAHQAGLHLLEDNAMPANNRLLVWRKQ